MRGGSLASNLVMSKCRGGAYKAGHMKMFTTGGKRKTRRTKKSTKKKKKSSRRKKKSTKKKRKSRSKRKSSKREKPIMKTILKGGNNLILVLDLSDSVQIRRWNKIVNFLKQNPKYFGIRNGRSIPGRHFIDMGGLDEAEIIEEKNSKLVHVYLIFKEETYSNYFTEVDSKGSQLTFVSINEINDKDMENFVNDFYAFVPLNIEQYFIVPMGLQKLPAAFDIPFTIITYYNEMISDFYFKKTDPKINQKKIISSVAYKLFIPILSEHQGKFLITRFIANYAQKYNKHYLVNILYKNLGINNVLIGFSEGFMYAEARSPEDFEQGLNPTYKSKSVKDITEDEGLIYDDDKSKPIVKLTSRMEDNNYQVIFNAEDISKTITINMNEPSGILFYILSGSRARLNEFVISGQIHNYSLGLLVTAYIPHT